MGKLRRAIAPSLPLGPPILTMYHSPHRIEGRSASRKGNEIRTLIIAGVALASLGAAWADDSTAEKAKKTDNCSYMLMDGQLVDLPVGANVCVRSPAPYTNEYALLHCYPPLQEIDLVTRGDSRCSEKYEHRERKT
ncbi:hypothetical protein ACVWXM_002272 [Bradyrhizobium sp. GM7.3]|jgi:hypothetical protein